MADGLSETETFLQKLKDSKRRQMYTIPDIEEINEGLLSFENYAENASPDMLIRLIQAFVERIYIPDEKNERQCHIIIKGYSKEDCDNFCWADGYIENPQEVGAVIFVLPTYDSDECCKTYNQNSVCVK